MSAYMVTYNGMQFKAHYSLFFQSLPSTHIAFNNTGIRVSGRREEEGRINIIEFFTNA